MRYACLENKILGDSRSQKEYPQFLLMSEAVTKRKGDRSMMVVPESAESADGKCMPMTSACACVATHPNDEIEKCGST